MTDAEYTTIRMASAEARALIEDDRRLTDREWAAKYPELTEEIQTDGERGELDNVNGHSFSAPIVTTRTEKWREDGNFERLLPSGTYVWTRDGAMH